MSFLLGGSYSPVTVKHYATLLKRLDKLGINYKKAKSAEEIKEEVLKYSNVSDTSIRVYLQAILFSGTNLNKKFIDSSRKFITNTSKNERIERGKNRLVGNQKNNYLDWSHILEVYKNVKGDANKSMHNMLDYVILSLYILFPPRRLTDYSEMVVSLNDDYKINKGVSKKYDSCNYYSPKKHIFIFNNYKTNKRVIRVDGDLNTNTYKQQVFKVPDNLATILDDYVKDEKIKDSESLLGMSPATLGDRISSIFTNLVSKNISVNILRHSFISMILADRKTYDHNDLFEISQRMAHNMNQQSQYYKNEKGEK